LLGSRKQCESVDSNEEGEEEEEEEEEVVVEEYDEDDYEYDMSVAPLPPM